MRPSHVVLGGSVRLECVMDVLIAAQAHDDAESSRAAPQQTLVAATMLRRDKLVGSLASPGVATSQGHRYCTVR